MILTDDDSYEAGSHRVVHISIVVKGWLKVRGSERYKKMVQSETKMEGTQKNGLWREMK